jgi:hypothetical protein
MLLVEIDFTSEVCDVDFMIKKHGMPRGKQLWHV